MKTRSIMIVGVGGQGSLLASRIIGNVLLSQGFDVKVSEADIIISFEQLEAARYVSYLKKGGHIITSTQQIDPMPVITGAAVYPEDIIGKLKAEGVDVIAVDALALAEQAGTAKASNVVLMGVVSTKMAFDEDVWQKALENCVPAKFLELNKKAFALGREVK